MNTPNQLPTLNTAVTDISVFQATDSREARAYFIQNKNRFEPWNPKPDNNFYTESYWISRAQASLELFRQQKAALMVARRKGASKVIATCTLNQILRGSIQSGQIGFSVAEEEEGRGIAFEVVSACIRYFFKHWNLHRVQATHDVRNHRSQALVKRLGFTQDSDLKDFLYINGQWQHHLGYSLINQEWVDKSGERQADKSA